MDWGMDLLPGAMNHMIKSGVEGLSILNFEILKMSLSRVVRLTSFCLEWF
jgi:hypothetical protein